MRVASTQDSEDSARQSVTAAVIEPVFADILCAVDGKEGGYLAVEHAVALTGPSGHLTLLGATSYRLEGDHRSAAIGPTEMKGIMDRAARVAADADVPVTVEIDPGSPPAQVILDWSVEHDLLVVGAPSSSWLGGMFVAGVGDTAVSELVTPLLFARRAPIGRRMGDRVLVASDGLEGSDAMVALAGRLTRAFDSEVTLVHAITHGDGLRHRRSAEQERRLHAQVATLRSATAGEVELLAGHGNAHDVIVNAAQDLGSSLVVMGSRQLTGLQAIGSVSRRVVHEATCSVLLIPPLRTC